MNKGSICKIMILLITLAFLSGCIGSKTTYVDGAKIEEVYSIGLFTPTTQMTRMSKCTVKTINHDGGEYGTPWVEIKTMEPCQAIGIDKDGFIQNVSGPIGPVLLNQGAAVGSAGIIADGLKNQNVSPGKRVGA